MEDPIQSSSPIIDLAYDGNADGLRDNMRSQALASLYYFNKVVLGYKDLSPKLHQEFCNHIQSTIRQQRRGYLMPRRHLKSTNAKGYGLWRLCGGGWNQVSEKTRTRLKDDPRNLRIGVFGQTEKPAQKYLKDPKWNLLNNQLLQWLFPEIVPPNINDTKWTDSEILLPRTGSYDESTIMCFGIDQRKTGYGFDIRIYDDIFDEEAAESEVLAQSVQEGFDYAGELFTDPSESEELILGTRWKYGTADVYGYIMDKLPAGEIVHSSLDDEEKGTKARTTGFVWYVRSILEVNPVTDQEEAIWPERFTPEVIEFEKKRLGPYKFSCLMMNNPIPTAGVSFPPDLLNEYVVINDPPDPILHPLDGTPDIRLFDLYRLSFYDPSSGGPSAGCEGAIVSVGMAADFRVFALHEWGDTKGYGQSVEMWHVLNDSFLFNDCYYEKVGSQKTIEEEIIPLRNLMLQCPLCKGHHRRLIPRPFQPPGGKAKDDRIFAFLDPIIQDKRLYLRKSMRALRTQIVTHPHSNLKDRLDALASGCSLLRPPVSEDEVREQRQAEEWALASKVSRTHTAYDVGGYV